MALVPDERPSSSILKFESMLKTNDVYFFDAEDFEEIIHHYLNNGKITLAKKAIKIGLQQHPAAIHLKLLNVEVLVFENSFQKAEIILDELQRVDSANEEIYIQRANIYSKKDNHEAAVELLQKALLLSQGSLDVYSLLGMEYLFMDNYDKARENFMICVEHDPDDYASLYNVVYCFEFLEEYDGAINYLNDYLERSPYCQVAWHQLGKQYFEKAMYKEALAAFDFAIIADDNFIGAYFEKGKVLEKMGEYEKAIESYETTISIEDPTSHAYLRMGKCHERLKNDDLAKYYYYQTVHEDPLLDKGWLAITDFYFRKGDYEKALFYMNKAINIDGQNPQYWKKCARIHAALKKYHEADFSYRQAVELGNYELDTWLNWSEVLAQNNDIEAAIQILIQGLEFYPDMAEMLYKMAGLYLMAQEPVKAQYRFVKALKMDINKLHYFELEFPAYYNSDWAQNIILNIKKASQ